MKHKLTLLLLALFTTIGAKAETINLGNSASFENNANTTFYKNGVVQTAGVWCDKATQGYVILTGQLSSYDGKIEVLKNGTPSLTISVPSVMTITGYSIGLKINQQNGTNSCTANNGGSDIELNGSSATTVSASGLSTNSVTINFTGTGDNNGECRLEFSDFTIEVSGTFVSSASQLSNTKAYVVTTARGQWTLNSGNTLLSSTHTSSGATAYSDADTSAEAKEFAIYKQGDYYYLYNLKAGKFVVFSNSNQGAPLYDYATLPYTVLTSNYSPYPLIVATYDSRNYANNNNAGGIAINTWKNQDDGNRLAIAEARDLTSEEMTALNNAFESSMANKHKAFTVTANRGTWCANSAGTSLATTTTNASYATDYEKFALMFLNDKYYLYNLGTKKFIKGDGSLNADGGDEISVRYSGDTSRPYMFFFPNGNASYTNPVYFNMQSGGGSYAMNEYSSPDDGNKQSITQTDAVYIGEMLAKFETVNDITDGDYHITTTIGGTKYYVTTAGKLTTCVADGGTFAISKTSGGSFDTGIRISFDSDSKRFTNPTLSNNHANLSQNYYATTTGDRADYERQVFFLNDEGKFAIRSCNVASAASSWGDAGRTFWTYNVGEAELTPCYSYDPAYVWELEAPGTTRNVTFNFYYGGSKVHEGSATMEEGAASTVPASLGRDFCTYICTPVTVSSSTNSIDVTVAWAGPFNLSADFASAHWYDMAVRGNWYVTSDNLDSDGALKTIEANALGLAEDAYQWAFVGDPWHVQLFNKYKGSSEVYAWASNENASIPAFVDASSSENYWWIRKSTASDDAYANAFLLTIPEYGYQVNQFSGPGGPLKIWQSNGTHDAGSAFTVFDVPDDFHDFAVAEIKPYASATGYFALKDAIKANIGWQDSYETSCPFATYKAMKLALQAIDMTDLSNFNLPQTGYYTLKSYVYNNYMGYKDGALYGNDENATDAKHIVKLTKTGSNTYTISLMGKFAPTTVEQSQTVHGSDDAGTYTVVMSKVGYAAFQADTDAAYSCLHRRQEGDVVGWTAPADASQWKVEDAESIQFEIGTGGDGWATAYLPFPYTTPEGVTAYTGTVNGSSLSLTEVSGTVPASTAVVIKGTGGTTPTFTIAAEADVITGNALQGSYDPVTVADGNNIYALAKKGDSVGFYPVGDGVVIPVGKAYLVYTASNPVKGFTFVFDEDDPTGIETIQDSKFKIQNEGVVYNLAGQRLNKMQKGINIVNGKKILK